MLVLQDRQEALGRWELLAHRETSVPRGRWDSSAIKVRKAKMAGRELQALQGLLDPLDLLDLWVQQVLRE